jgi:hypothetical protein
VGRAAPPSFTARTVELSACATGSVHGGLVSLMHVVRFMSWRLIEWSFVMGALCWLLIHVWTDPPLHSSRNMRRRDRLRAPGSCSSEAAFPAVTLRGKWQETRRRVAERWFS